MNTGFCSLGLKNVRAMDYFAFYFFLIIVIYETFNISPFSVFRSKKSCEKWMFLFNIFVQETELFKVLSCTLSRADLLTCFSLCSRTFRENKIINVQVFYTKSLRVLLKRNSARLLCVEENIISTVSCIKISIHFQTFILVL